MTVFTAVLPEDLKIMSIQFWPSSLSPAHRDSSWFSESFDDIMVGSPKSSWNSYFISSHVTDLLSVNLISCQILLSLIGSNNCSLLSSLFQLFFFRCVDAIKIKMSWYCSWNRKMSQFEHQLCSSGSIEDETWVPEIWRSLHSGFIDILHSIPTF